MKEKEIIKKIEEIIKDKNFKNSDEKIIEISFLIQNNKIKSFFQILNDKFQEELNLLEKLIKEYWKYKDGYLMDFDKEEYLMELIHDNFELSEKEIIDIIKKDIRESISHYIRY